MQDLLERLGAPERRVQREACREACERVKSEPPLRDALLELLRAGSPLARFGAAWVIFRSGRPSLRLLAPLLDALELEDGDRRWEAAHMLVLLGRLQAEVFPVLCHESAGSDVAARRRMALYALRELAPEREETQRALLAALDDADAEVRRAACSSLGKLSAPEPHVLERVLAMLGGDPDPRMQQLASVLAVKLLDAYPDERGRVQAALEQALTGSAGLAKAARVALSRLEISAPNQE
jgi:HEAT repeat protein